MKTLWGVILVILVGGCATREAGREESRWCEEGPCSLLTLRYRVSDVQDLHLGTFWYAVDRVVWDRSDFDDRVFFVRFDRGRVVRNRRAVAVRDEGTEWYSIQDENAVGGYVSFRRMNLLTSEHYGDCTTEWLAVVGWTGDSLREALEAGGAGCYLILIHNGREPPDSYLRVEEFDDVQWRMEDGMATDGTLRVTAQLRFSYTQDSKEGQSFATGGGEVVVAVPP